jgi:uncharacterized membrane protein
MCAKQSGQLLPGFARGNILGPIAGPPCRRTGAKAAGAPLPRQVVAPPRRHRAERGAVTVEAAVLVPVLVLLFLLVVQVALWALAEEEAGQIAARAAATAASLGGDRTTGVQVGWQDEQRLAGSLLTDPQVSVVVGPQRARAEVHGDATAIIPWLHLPATAERAAVVQRFRAFP